MNKPTGKQVAEDLLDMMNSLGGNEKEQQAFVDTILNSHRTLQQSTCGLLVKVFDGWATMKADGYYDLRNEATVKLAERVSKAVEGEYLPLI